MKILIILKVLFKNKYLNYSKICVCSSIYYKACLKKYNNKKRFRKKKDPKINAIKNRKTVLYTNCLNKKTWHKC